MTGFQIVLVIVYLLSLGEIAGAFLLCGAAVWMGERRAAILFGGLGLVAIAFAVVFYSIKG